MPTIEEAAQALNTGHRDEARRILMYILAGDLYNVDVLLWIAAVAETQDERSKWLQRVVEIDPNNQRALSALHLSPPSEAASLPGAPAQIAQPKSNDPQPALAEKLTQVQQSLATSETERSRMLRRYQTSQIMAIIAVVILMVGLFVLIAAPMVSPLGQIMVFGGGLFTTLACIVGYRAQAALRKMENQMVQAKADAMKQVVLLIAEWLVASYR